MDINSNINNKTPMEEIFCKLKGDIENLKNNNLIADYLGCPQDCDCCQVNEKIKGLLPTTMNPHKKVFKILMKVIMKKKVKKKRR